MTARRLVCFRSPGGVGRHPVEVGADPLPVLERLARLVPCAEWWVEEESPRHAAAVVENEA